MPRLSIEVPHALGQEEATRRLQDRFAAAEAQYRERIDEFRGQWSHENAPPPGKNLGLELHDERTDHTFSFSVKTMGVGVSGSIAVAPARVAVDLNLPWAAMLFKRTIEDRLRQELERLLASGNAGP